MNLDNYIKTILSGIRTWAQSTFAKKSDIKDMYYDSRTLVTTKEVTVNGTVGVWGYIKVADTLDFDINQIVSMSRYGNDGLNFTNVPVETRIDYGATDIVTEDDWSLATYFKTQKEADEWWNDDGNPFTPGLYMWMQMDEGEPCSVAYSFTYHDGELHKIDPKYIDIPLATESSPGAVHPWINDEYGQDVWMNPEDGRLYTYNNSYTLPVAHVNRLGGVKPVAKTTDMAQEVGVDSSGRLYTQASNNIGQSTTGKSYTINGETVVAGSGAEIFNHYTDNKASGVYSHAEGASTEAFGGYSHAEGYDTVASGDYSHAEGRQTKVRSSCSHAEGYNTSAWGWCQHVQGKYNIDDTNDVYAHIVGNGTSYSNKSNAHTLDWDGNAWFSGDVYVGSTTGANKDNGSKKLATEEYVNIAINTVIGTAIGGSY